MLGVDGRGPERGTETLPRPSVREAGCALRAREEVSAAWQWHLNQFNRKSGRFGPVPLGMSATADMWMLHGRQRQAWNRLMGAARHITAVLREMGEQVRREWTEEYVPPEESLYRSCYVFVS